jgi:hypothetical protein
MLFINTDIDLQLRPHGDNKEDHADGAHFNDRSVYDDDE